MGWKNEVDADARVSSNIMLHFVIRLRGGIARLEIESARVPSRRWKLIQLIFPALILVLWLVAFAYADDIVGQKRVRIEVIKPSFVVLSATAKDKATIPLGYVSLRGGEMPAHSPVFKVRGELATSYVKTAVATTYDGRRWLLTNVAKCNGFDQPNLSSGVEFTSPDNFSSTYYDFDIATLKEAKTIDDTQYLSLPSNIPHRVYQLAQDITQGMSTPFEKAKAIETFLRVACRYDPDYAPTPSNWEANDWFLFEPHGQLPTNES